MVEAHYHHFGASPSLRFMARDVDEGKQELAHQFTLMGWPTETED